MITTRLTVDGMKCGACQRHVESALRRAPGVRNAAVNLESRLATVDYDAARVTPEYLIAAVREAGYSARIAEAVREAAVPADACGCGPGR